MVHFFQQPVSEIPIPEEFTNPFDYKPHPLCIAAVKEVEEELSKMAFWKEHPEEGKMFGVLVIQTPEKILGFLAAFSGILAGSYLHPYFVPPIYNLQNPSGFFRQEEQQISAINTQIRQLEESPEYLRNLQRLKEIEREAETALSSARIQLKKNKAHRDMLRQQTDSFYDMETLARESQYQKAEFKRLEQKWKAQITALQNETTPVADQIEQLKTERKQRSANLQQKLFEQFQLLNANGEIRNLYDIFQAYNHSIPPAGAGECAAPKLLQYAYLHQLKPIAMAEFWWGCSPKTEIRRQGNFYPACQGKCGPILHFMLQGLDTETPVIPGKQQYSGFPEIVYEDRWLLVINKPEGLLSIPGKTTQPSVYTLVRQRYPEATGPLLVHRLDMDTSGLLVIAKDKDIHERLQKQFLRQTVRKRYVALLDGTIRTTEGCIALPLRPDLYDRPRQIADDVFGKPAVTRYRVLEKNGRYTRIAFYPQTGRTHQLRVHAAHPLGLDCPIAGDPLYGKSAERLYLHAEYIEFTHPVTGQKIALEKPADF